VCILSALKLRFNDKSNFCGFCTSFIFKLILTTVFVYLFAQIGEVGISIMKCFILANGHSVLHFHQTLVLNILILKKIKTLLTCCDFELTKDGSHFDFSDYGL